MYDDDPNWRQFFGILKNLYPEHPLHIDIAGTIESIAEITADDLYRCYHTFYHPSNMTLFIVGSVDPEALLEVVRKNQAAKEFAPIKPIERYFPEEKLTDIVPFSSLEMPVSRAKAVVGIKGQQEALPRVPYELLRFRTALNLLFQLMLGNTSSNYLHLYNEGVIDDTFGFEFSLDRSFHFADFSGDTDNPDAFADAIEDILLDFASDPEVNQQNLTLLKKKMLGKYFQSLNSLEFIANQFTQDLFGEVTLFDVPQVIQSVELADVLAAGKQFIHKEAFSRFYLEPIKDARS